MVFQICIFSSSCGSPDSGNEGRASRQGTSSCNGSSPSRQRVPSSRRRPRRASRTSSPSCASSTSRSMSRSARLASVPCARSLATFRIRVPIVFSLSGACSTSAPKTTQTITESNILASHKIINTISTFSGQRTGVFTSCLHSVFSFGVFIRCFPDFLESHSSCAHE